MTMLEVESSKLPVRVMNHDLCFDLQNTQDRMVDYNWQTEHYNHRQLQTAFTQALYLIP